MQDTLVYSALATHEETDADFTQLVNAAFKDYHSVLSLARSPLAHTALVTPLLVLDDVSPTAAERGHALRLLLEWAVARLAPGTVRHPLGGERPYDDPTWRDPHWWRYNILRHRYLEPLHPDEFVQGGRFTETLLALTGIPSADTFFDERNRAIREVAAWLHQQASSGQADAELQQLALEQVYQPLQHEPTALALLNIAATFDDVFPRALLLAMAGQERLNDVEETLDRLCARRFLLVGDAGLNLWLSPVLREYVYARQDPAQRRQRHLQVARYYRGQAAWLQAARHLLRAGRQQDAAHLLLAEADELINELQLDDLCETLQEFRRGQLAASAWVEIQLLLCDLLGKAGRQEEAVAACRRALAATEAPEQQARIYHRMGKLYEKHNQLHALGYYQQAVELLPGDSDELAALLKDRAWLYILRQEWALAEQDLALALQATPTTARTARANVFDALASLRRHQKRYDEAIQHAQIALVLREAAGDLLLVAASSNNLGLIYNDMGEYDHAIAAFREAMETYGALGNRSLIAGALLNIGMAFHLGARLHEAADAYRASLAICREVGLPLVEVRAQYNLAESLAELGDGEQARGHWSAGMQAAQAAGFEDEVADFLALQQTTDALRVTEPVARYSAPHLARAPVAPPLEPEVQLTVDWLRSEGRITPKTLMRLASVSKATATRRLAGWVESGLLQKHGQGRGTCYTLANRAQHAAIPVASLDNAQVALNPLAQTSRAAIEQLADDFALTALGLPVSASLGSEPHAAVLRLVARFSRLPTLPRFFELEQRLGELLEREVDLVPFAAAAPGAQTALRQEPRWVWQRKPFGA